MRPDSSASTSVETAYLEQLCKDARELRETAQELLIASQTLRLLCKAAVARSLRLRTAAPGPSGTAATPRIARTPL